MSEDTKVLHRDVKKNNKNKKTYKINKNKRNIVIGIIGIIIVVFISISNYFISKYLYNGRIAQNIKIEDIDVSNLTKEEALDTINAKYHPESLYLTYDSKKYIIKPKQIDLKYDTKEIIEEAYNLTRKGSYSENILTYINTKLTGKSYKIKSSYDDKKLDKKINQISDKIHVKYVSAKLIFSSDLSIKPSKTGLRCDDKYNKEKIVESYKKKSYNEIPLKVDVTQPRVKEEDLQGVDTKLASFSTKYSAYQAERAYNIYLAAKRCNGTVLMPGETFSYNGQTGIRTLKNGFRNAPVIVSGTLINAPGGGVCQGSTTIFNAALLAGLKITDVQNHSIASHYVSRGRDAMVNDSDSDLKFKNTFDNPVVVYASASNGKIEAAIYGYAEDKVDVDIKVKHGYSGSKTYRTVKKDGKSKKELIYNSVYRY